MTNGAGRPGRPGGRLCVGAAWLLLAVAAGCGPSGGRDAARGSDAGGSDAGGSDAGGSDAGGGDAGGGDAGVGDAGADAGGDAGSDAASDAGTCVLDSACVESAHCEGGVCVPDRAAGGACVRAEECEPGLSCVDAVCCTTACAGSCTACDLPGTEGTCTPFAPGEDPQLECGGLACSGWYVGFDAAHGDTCWTRAPAGDAAVACDGAGACADEAALCPSQPDGTLQIDCDDLCQMPAAGTCAGTVPGACLDLSPGLQTCGTGACERTEPVCLGGAPVVCVPGAPGTESCNGADDDCDGSVDEEVLGCTSAYPAASCLAILDGGFSIGDGIYWIQIGAGAPFEVHCLMSADGGGWTLVANFPWPGNTAGVAGWTGGGMVGASFTDLTSAFKLADADLNSLRTWGFRGHGTASWCFDPPSFTYGPCAIDTLAFWGASCAYASGANSTACSTAYYDVDLTLPIGWVSPCPWHYGLVSAACGTYSTFGSSNTGNHVFVGDYTTSVHAYDGSPMQDPSIQVWVR